MKTLEELNALDADRTKGEWTAGKSGKNPRKGQFISFSRVDAEFDDRKMRDLCVFTFPDAASERDAAFIAAMPDAMKLLNRFAEALKFYCNNTDNGYVAREALLVDEV